MKLLILFSSFEIDLLERILCIESHSRTNPKATRRSSLTSTSLSATAAQRCRCYSQAISPPYSVLIFSAVEVLFRLVEAFVGQVEAVQQNRFRQVKEKKKSIAMLAIKDNLSFPPRSRVWARVNRIKKTHQFSTVIDRAVNSQHLPIYLRINSKNRWILLRRIVTKPRKPAVSVGVAVVPVHGMSSARFFPSICPASPFSCLFRFNHKRV